MNSLQGRAHQSEMPFSPARITFEGLGVYSKMTEDVAQASILVSP